MRGKREERERENKYGKREREREREKDMRERMKGVYVARAEKRVDVYKPRELSDEACKKAEVS